MRMALTGALLAAGCLWNPALAATDTTVATRIGDHAGFGRIVFDFGTPTSFEVMESGSRLTLTFAGAPDIRPPALRPRNVVGIQAADGTATIQLAPGATASVKAAGARVIVDVADPVRSSPGRQPARAAPASPIAPTTIRAPAPPPLEPSDSEPATASALPIPLVHRGPGVPAWSADGAVAKSLQTALPAPADQAPAQPAPTQSAPIPAAPASLRPAPAQSPLPEPGAAPPPNAPASPNLAVPISPMGPAEPLVIPAEPGVGVAAFRALDRAMIVFDQAVEIDLDTLRSGLRAPDATIDRREAVTVISFPVHASASMRVLRVRKGWQIESRLNEPSPSPIEAMSGPQRIAFAARSPGRVVAIPDPRGGGMLLVGTVTDSDGRGPGSPIQQRSPDYTRLPSWLGLALEPHSDRTDLTSTASGFVLRGPQTVMATAPEPLALPTAPSFTRNFDFPKLAAPQQLQRLYAQQSAAAAAPPRGRTPTRLAVAQTLVALGLGIEAQAVLAAIMADDPAAAEDPFCIGLNAIAAVLADRLTEAEGLGDPRLSGSDEMAAWRQVRNIVAGLPNAESGSALSALPILNAYPDELRNRLLPKLAEAAVEGAGPEALADVLRPFGASPLISYARARQLERAGDTAGALAAYDALTMDKDRLIQVKAAIRATELKLAAGQVDAARAADMMDRLSFAWRGDQRESDLRFRAAELRTMAGAWRPALDAIRDIARLNEDPPRPGLESRAREAIGNVFRSMLDPGGRAVAPIDFVALASEFAGSLPTDAAAQALLATMAEKLTALDLPARARPLLTTMMQAAAKGPVRAGIGVRLAELALDEGAGNSVATILAASDAPDLPAALIEQRAMVDARARAANGDRAGAAARLAALGTPAADELRATLLAEAKDWPGSLAAISTFVAKTVPAEGPLSDVQQDALLRQASAAVQAGDVGLLGRMQAHDLQRLQPPRSEVLRVLVAPAVGSSADLPRAAQEVALARALPGRLQGLAAR